MGVLLGAGVMKPMLSAVLATSSGVSARERARAAGAYDRPLLSSAWAIIDNVPTKTCHRKMPIIEGSDDHYMGVRCPFQGGQVPIIGVIFSSE